LHGIRPRAGRARGGQGLGRLRVVLVARVVEGHGGARARTRERDGAPYAARAAGHEHAMAGELAHARPAPAATSAATCPLGQTSSRRNGAGLASARAPTSARGHAAAKVSPYDAEGCWMWGWVPSRTACSARRVRSAVVGTSRTITCDSSAGRTPASARAASMADRTPAASRSRAGVNPAACPTIRPRSAAPRLRAARTGSSTTTAPPSPRAGPRRAPAGGPAPPTPRPPAPPPGPAGAPPRPPPPGPPRPPPPGPAGAGGGPPRPNPRRPPRREGHRRAAQPVPDADLACGR